MKDFFRVEDYFKFFTRLFVVLSAAFFVSWASYVFYINSKPEIVDINDIIKSEGVENYDTVVGDATVSALIYSVDTMLHKRGGYTANDLAVKIGLFDDMPSFERGVIAQARELAYALRDQFSKSNSSDLTNEYVKMIQPLLNFHDDAWNPLASSEGSYGEAVELSRFYLKGISNPEDQKSMFFTRAVSLEEYFKKVSQRLGDLSQLLSGSRGDLRENTDLANDPTAQVSSNKGRFVYAHTEWSEIDNVFWRARGETWALLHYLKAIEIDFAKTLDDKNALPSLKQIIRELEKTQEPVYSPVILNGSGFGLVSNYSLTMANYISRAKSSIQDLQALLNNG